ncbi:MAG: class I SAM-dependent methyltransferase [Candidatus Melainabacteria bacterium]|jgi:2-polyprenyl-3-methyl-5-hydroxy-6-metoxy-1,4-benzoquinol methylase|nr:class I SAM-dependent methyltransferase [Candidatus Melainabacteria bacterium]
MACLLCDSEEQQQLGNKDSYKVVECSGCGLRFLDPIPSEQALNEYYNCNQNQRHYIKVADRKLKSGKRKIKKLIKYSMGQAFVDVGCNAGANTEAARQLGFSTLGIDLGSTVIDNARELFPENRFEVMSIENLAEQVKQKQNDAFDLVFCSEVLEHTTDPSSFIKSVKAILNPGGILYLTTPDAGHFRVPKDFTTWKHVHTPDHICYFNRKNLTQLLEQHGLEVIKFRWTTRANLQVIARSI